MLVKQAYFHPIKVGYRTLRWKLNISGSTATLIITRLKRPGRQGSRLVVKISSLSDPALYFPQAVPKHPQRLPDEFIQRARSVAFGFGWLLFDAPATFTLRHTNGVFTPLHRTRRRARVPAPLGENAQELIRILASGTLPPLGNERLFFKEAANHEVWNALEIGDWEGALQWTERCLQILEPHSLHAIYVLLQRLRMLRLFGHREGHVVLDARKVVADFFEGVIWTPEEAERLAEKERTMEDSEEEWTEEDGEVSERLSYLRMHLSNLQLIAYVLPPAEQQKMEPWFAVKL